MTTEREKKDLISEIKNHPNRPNQNQPKPKPEPKPFSPLYNPFARYATNEILQPDENTGKFSQIKNRHFD
jgi:hypothetical protein